MCIKAFVALFNLPSAISFYATVQFFYTFGVVTKELSF